MVGDYIYFYFIQKEKVSDENGLCWISSIPNSNPIDVKYKMLPQIINQFESMIINVMKL